MLRSRGLGGGLDRCRRSPNGFFKLIALFVSIYIYCGSVTVKGKPGWWEKGEGFV